MHNARKYDVQRVSSTRGNNKSFKQICGRGLLRWEKQSRVTTTGPEERRNFSNIYFETDSLSFVRSFFVRARVLLIRFHAKPIVREKKTFFSFLDCDFLAKKKTKNNPPKKSRVVAALLVTRVLLQRARLSYCR